MARDQINTSLDNDQDHITKPVTGSDLGSGKRGMDVVSFASGAGLEPSEYDDIVLTYSGTNLTQVLYKLATVTVKTLTLTYTGSQLDRVEIS